MLTCSALAMLRYAGDASGGNIFTNAYERVPDSSFPNLSAPDISMPMGTLAYIAFGCLLAFVLGSIGIRKANEAIKAAAVALWLLIVCYGLLTAWSLHREASPVPFINKYAMTMALIAFVGFCFSLRISFARLRMEDNRLLAVLYSGVSQLIVGLLLFGQSKQLIHHYGLGHVLNIHLTISVFGGLYALSLFAWAACSKQSSFRVLGSLTLLSVSVITLVCDWPSVHQLMYKSIVLFILGLITLAIAYINGLQPDQARTKRSGTSSAPSRYRTRSEAMQRT